MGLKLLQRAEILFWIEH